jgi:superfamily II DNA/RNA helicase
VYGQLPPETRSKQAHLFNDPDSGYDVLVASDAIGMGKHISREQLVKPREPEDFCYIICPFTFLFSF